MSLGSSIKLAALTCVAAVSCLVSPVDYPVGDIDGNAGTPAQNAGNGGAAGEIGGGGSAGSAGTAGILAGGSAGSSGSIGTGGGGSSGLGGSAGTAGTGPSAVCGVIPSKSTWLASAPFFNPPDPAQQAIDDDPSTRFSTGAAQSFGQWLEIDFGESVSLSAVTLSVSTTSMTDYPRGYEVTVSDTASNTNGTPATGGAGEAALDLTIDLGAVVSGRYLLIEITQAVETSWWSVNELAVACE
jgi:hypothetical protein